MSLNKPTHSQKTDTLEKSHKTCKIFRKHCKRQQCHILCVWVLHLCSGVRGWLVGWCFCLAPKRVMFLTKHLQNHFTRHSRRIEVFLLALLFKLICKTPRWHMTEEVGGGPFKLCENYRFINFVRKTKHRMKFTQKLTLNQLYKLLQIQWSKHTLAQTGFLFSDIFIKSASSCSQHNDTPSLRQLSFRVKLYLCVRVYVWKLRTLTTLSMLQHMSQSGVKCKRGFIHNLPPFHSIHWNLHLFSFFVRIPFNFLSFLLLFMWRFFRAVCVTLGV